MNCAGGATFYGRFFACDTHHGAVNIRHAIPYSCDTYYYTLAHGWALRRLRIGRTSRDGQKTGIDLPREAAGVVPSEEWKLRNYHEKWYAGEVISVGIGQGAVAMSPMQFVRTIAGSPPAA